MMTTTWRILWIPVAGAILIFRTAEDEARFLVVPGTSARHCSVRPVVNVRCSEKVRSARIRAWATRNKRENVALLLRGKR